MAPRSGSGRGMHDAVVVVTVLLAAAVVVVTAAAAVREGEAEAEAAAAAVAATTVSCGDAVSALAPCGSFLVGADGGAAAVAAPSESCCRSALALRRMADTAGARRALCRCLEQSGPSFGVLPERARQLPARCKLGLAIPVGPNTDCDKIS